MKHLFAILTALLITVSPVKATTIDSWTNYFSYYDATEVIEADGMLYAIMNSNLMAYDLKTTEVSYIDRITAGLSSKGIVLMGYSNTQRNLVIVYSDGNIDLYDVRSGSVVNIPQFRDNPDSDFSLNNLKVQGDEAYLATNEGVIAIDVKDAVIRGRYPIGKTSTAIRFGERIFAARLTADGKQGNVVSALLTDNLFDKTRWQTETEKPISDMSVMNDCLYMFCPYNEFTNKGEVPDAGIWVKCERVQNGDIAKISSFYPLKARSVDGRTIAYGFNNSYQDKVVVEFTSDYPDRATVVRTDVPFNSIYPAKQGGYWTALSSVGLTHYSLADGSFKADSESLNGGGPSHEFPYWLRFEGDRLFMAAGRIDPTDKDHRPFNAAWLDTDADDWTYLEVPYGEKAGGGPWMRKGADFRDASSIAQDPLDPNHHFVTSGSQGLFEYRNGKIVKQYTEERKKTGEGEAEGWSAMKSVSGSLSYDYVRTGAAIFDRDGNLFVANSGGGTAFMVDTIMWCLKRDGKWLPFYHAPIRNATCFENSIFDRKGRLWVTQRRTAGDINAGFLCMDFNGTLDNTRDDVYTYRDKFTNQDGTPFTFQQALAIAEDRDGRIWMGTEAGLIVCDDPDRWASPDFLITQVKVPRPDGIYADYLLLGVTVTAIAVDGANRKWIGTSGDGLYLISADGITTLHHFTTDNSPLISNNIWSIACHPKNGEVFIGTDLGLMSYHSDASEAEESLSRDNLRVYPNPVRPDYSGPIVLDGLVYDSDIKVVSTSGHVVAAGTSVGGTFTWNGRGPSGQRVGSGIYYFMVATPDGNQTTVAKVAVVR